MLLELGVLGAELVFNLLLDFQVGLHVHLKLTCLLYSETEVRRCWFSVAGSFVLSLLSRPSASQAESGFPFFFPLLIFLFSLKEFLHHHFHHLL